MVDLSEYDKMYKDAKIQEGSGDFEQIPEGTYQVFVDGVEIKETKAEKKPMLAWKLKIMNGQHEGRYLFKNSVISDKSIEYIKTDLSICKLGLKKFSDLQKKLNELLNLNIEVKVVNKGENQNVYFQRLLSVDNGSMVNEDEIPF